MTATRYDFTLELGKDLDFTVQVWANAAKTIAYDLSGYDAAMMIRPDRYDTGTPYVSLTSNPAAGLTVSGTSGQVSVHIDAADSAAYTWFNGQYDIEVTNGTITKPVAYGNVSVRPEVTR